MKQGTTDNSQKEGFGRIRFQSMFNLAASGYIVTNRETGTGFPRNLQKKSLFVNTWHVFEGVQIDSTGLLLPEINGL
jgi:hypothetical protein